MAKPLGPKSTLIRKAIKDNPELGNVEIADLLNASPERLDDKINISVLDVAQQKQALKKMSEGVPAESPAPSPEPKGKRGRPRKVVAPGSVLAASSVASPLASPIELIDKTLALAGACGGIKHLKRLVDRLADM